ncbi:flagellar biosynthesis anti-sigma factor FlgM [Desulfurivibrio sp. D14AmB]|uniref:flagellar biosynthesis anti-sigma factor FlgM n=1 Tax=Desulfurivibrio sp. D14AmB TaxID=3374370 RepID=UPI00376F3055
MKLTNIFPQLKTEKLPVKRSQETAASAPTGAAQTGDRVDLSSSTQDIQRVKEVLAQTPEVRLEKIRALKGQIERGEYQVDAQAVADRMLQSLLSDSRLIS